MSSALLQDDRARPLALEGLQRPPPYDTLLPLRPLQSWQTADTFAGADTGGTEAVGVAVSVRLLCADMRHVFIPPVDLIVTDPPYRVISGGVTGPDRPTGILRSNDSRIFQHNDIAFADYLPQLYRVLRDPGHLYLMVNFFNLEEALAATRQAGFDIHNLLVWHKNTVTPNRWYMKNCEYVIFARKGKAVSINDCGSKTVHSYTNPTGDRDHPTQKPVDLMRLYIENSSQPGDLVLDPFMGSGSTGVAATACGRRFLGIEMDPKYYAVACRRMGVLP